MTIFKPIYPPQTIKHYTLFPQLTVGKTAIEPIYVNPAQVVSIGMRGTVPSLYLTDGRCIETQFPTTEHLEWYMATSSNLYKYRGKYLQFDQVTEIGSDDSDPVDPGRDNSDLYSGDCQSEGQDDKPISATYPIDGPIYGNTLPILEDSEDIRTGVYDPTTTWK